MKIHDTSSNQKKDIDISKEVGIYLCGVTVYDDSHIGHARTIIIFDILRRYIESKGVKVKLVQNFTDVDDKIIDKAKKEDQSCSYISSKYIQDYHDVFSKLNVKRAAMYPKATEHIEDMQNLIKTLIERKIAYVTKNGVYFSVSKFSRYGRLSKKDPHELQSGARVKIDETKQNSLDFALWKFSDSRPFWDSPWKKGRPGWHIECSAMSLKYLGANFEIHGGGRDLIFPHHENEIAQSESYTKESYAKIWMHVGMVTINGEKMSKSLGNIKSVKCLLKNWSPNVIRLFCIGGHYSKPLDYSEDLLKEYEINWNKARLAYYKLIQTDNESPADKNVDQNINQIKNEFEKALDDNLNTHVAISAFFSLVLYSLGLDVLSVSIAEKILPVFEDIMDILGLKIHKVSEEQKNQIKMLISHRDALRIQKKYDDADKIRDDLELKGIKIKDEADKTIWLKSE